MFFVMGTLVNGFQFTNPTRKSKYKSVGMGFVDDVTLGCTETVQNREKGISKIDNITVSTQNVTSQIQDTVQTWEKLLYVDGGKLELSKCYWILIVWKWINGVAHLADESEANADLHITQSESKERVTIRRISTTEAPKILGCHVAED